MPSDDTEYYRQRAATERAMAQAASQSNVAEIHEELARQYEALVEQVELRPTFGIAVPTRLSGLSSARTSTGERSANA